MRKKTTTARSAVKAAAAEARAVEVKGAEAAPVEEKPAEKTEAKPVEVKEEVKAEEKAEAKKAAKPAAKKPAAKAAPAKKEEVKPEVFVQFQGQEAVVEDVIEKAKKQFTEEGHRVSTIKTIQVYLKPEEYAAYYVINQKYTGRVDLFQNLKPIYIENQKSTSLPGLIAYLIPLDDREITITFMGTDMLFKNAENEIKKITESIKLKQKFLDINLKIQ